MREWRDVVEARFVADTFAGRCEDTPLCTNDPGVMWALLAVAAEVRALAVLIDYVSGDAR